MPHIDLHNLNSVLLPDDALRARKLQRRQAGVLHVTSGLVVACDPLVQADRAPFRRRLKQRGEFTVEVLRDASPALAVLWLRDRAACVELPLTWELALVGNQQLESLAPEEFFGYPVDAGVGCFMDADAAAAMAERERHHAENGDDDFNYYDSVLAEEMGDDELVDHYPLGQGSANNLVIFRSGWGDGSYPSYWALDPDGEPVALVTDFMTIVGGDARTDDDKRREAEAEEAEQNRRLAAAQRDAIVEPAVDTTEERLPFWKRWLKFF